MKFNAQYLSLVTRLLSSSFLSLFLSCLFFLRLSSFTSSIIYFCTPSVSFPLV